MECVKFQRKPTRNQQQQDLWGVQWYLYEWDKLHTEKETGLLYQNRQLVPPHIYSRRVYQELHEKMGDLGAERVYVLACERFYWLPMKNDIEHFIHYRCQCLKQKRPNRAEKDPLRQIVTTAPFEIVSVDFVHLERSSAGYEYILVIVYHFARYCQAYPTRNKSS